MDRLGKYERGEGAALTLPSSIRKFSSSRPRVVYGGALLASLLLVILAFVLVVQGSNSLSILGLLVLIIAAWVCYLTLAVAQVEFPRCYQGMLWVLTHGSFWAVPVASLVFFVVLANSLGLGTFVAGAFREHQRLQLVEQVLVHHANEVVFVLLITVALLAVAIGVMRESSAGSSGGMRKARLLVAGFTYRALLATLLLLGFVGYYSYSKKVPDWKVITFAYSVFSVYWIGSSSRQGKVFYKTVEAIDALYVELAIYKIGERRREIVMAARGLDRLLASSCGGSSIFGSIPIETESYRRLFELAIQDLTGFSLDDPRGGSSGKAGQSEWWASSSCTRACLLEELACLRRRLLAGADAAA